MSFVGAVNVLPPGSVGRQPATQQVGAASGADAQAPLFVRPHDVEVYLTPQADTVPARLKRLVHMGRDLQAELVLADATEIVAQIPREKIDYSRLQPGDELHVLSRQAKVFIPDYAI
jgi:sulfate transport system ATP-binding protein